MNPDDLYMVLEGVPRAGPGSDAATREAILRLPALPENPVVVDLGCGPGRQTLVLAKELGCRVTAIDIYAPFLARLAQAAAQQGLAERIATCLADLNDLNFPRDTVDLFWAEGALYLLGFEDALFLLRPMVKPGGFVVASEVTWLTDEPPEEARLFWDEEYPDMANVAGNRHKIERAGFELYERFMLRPQDWWPDYYFPVAQRIATLRPDATPEMSELLDAFEREIMLFRKHGTAYGYVFYLMRRI